MFPLAKTCALPRAKTVAKPHRRGINSPLTLPLMLAEQKNKIKRYDKFPRISCISFRLFFAIIIFLKSSSSSSPSTYLSV